METGRSGVSAARLRLRGTLRPLPQPIRDRRRESVAQGPGDQHDLAAVVRLVSHEIGQHVPYVERKIAPDVGRRPRDRATRFTAEGEEPEDALAAPPQGRYQFPAPDPASVDAARHRDPQFLAQSLDPRAPGIVDVAGDHANRSARRTRDSRRPQPRRQVLHQEDRDPIAGPPGVEDRTPQVGDHDSASQTMSQPGQQDGKGEHPKDRTHRMQETPPPEQSLRLRRLGRE
jgi:hypothetical protein